MTETLLFLGAVQSPSARPLTLITDPAVSYNCYSHGAWAKPIFFNNPSPSKPYTNCTLTNIDAIHRCRASSMGCDTSRYSIRTSSTIESIYDTAVRLWPGMDIMVCAIKPTSLWPATDLCYDILIKPAPIPGSITPHLTKLTVFFRHADRYPTGKIPHIDNILANQGIEYDPGQLMPKGIDKALAFAHNLECVYDLSPIVCDTACMSSPVRRCIETADYVLQGLGITTQINIAPILDATLIIDVESVSNHLPALHEAALDLIEQVSARLNLSYVPLPQARAFFVVSKLMNNMTAYQGMGFDVSQLLGADLWFELKVIGTAAANWLFSLLAEQNRLVVRAVLDVANQSPSKLVLCSTHDTILFTLAQYYRLRHSYPTVIEVPGYLASIRIELWSDGCERVFYNNRLLN